MSNKVALKFFKHCYKSFETSGLYFIVNFTIHISFYKFEKEIFGQSSFVEALFAINIFFVQKGFFCLFFVYIYTKAIHCRFNPYSLYRTLNNNELDFIPTMKRPYVVSS